MSLTDYSIDTSGSPQDVQRRQALADALMKQGGDTSPAAGGPIGGWATIAGRALTGALGGYQRGQAAQEQQQGQDSYKQQLAAALQGNGGKIDPQTLISLAGNQWANPSQTQAVTHVADMQAQQARQAVEDQHFAQTLAIQKQNAARLADKTPSGFEANPDYGKVDGAPEWRPVTGGPQDPNYIKNAAEAKSGNYDPQLVGSLADRLQAGDATWKVGLARNAGIIMAVESEVAKRSAAAKEADPNANPAVDVLQARANQAGRVREQATLGGASANNTLYGNAAASTMDTAIEKSRAVPRGSFVPITRLMQMGQSAISDPNLAELRTATNTLINDYAKAITPVGKPTDSAMEHARQMLDMADSPETYEKVVHLMHREIANTHNAINYTKQELQSGKPGPLPDLKSGPDIVTAQPDPAAVEAEMRKRGLIQ